MALYRDLDRAALDAEYNLRERVPEHVDFLARWAAASAEVRRRLQCRIDVAYGRSPLERLDAFPAVQARAPLFVFFHGGYWQRLDKGDFSFLAPAFVEAGIGFVSVNYDLAPGATMDEIVEEARAAVAWVRSNAAELGGDAGAVFVGGHSAGAHLAAMVAADQAVAGLVCISGVYDLEPVRLCHVNEVLNLDAEAARRNSPLHLRPKAPIPVILAVGGDETAEFIRQQEELAAAWRPNRSLVLPGRHHYAAADALGDPDHALFGLVLDMVDGRLG